MFGFGVVLARYRLGRGGVNVLLFQSKMVYHNDVIPAENRDASDL